MKKGNFSAMVRALVELHEAQVDQLTPSVVIRPLSFGLVMPGVAFGLRGSGGVALRRVDATGSWGDEIGNDLSFHLERWQLLTLAQLAKSAQPAKPKAKRQRPSTGRPKGRPAGSVVAARFPGWIAAADAAVTLGLSVDYVRRLVSQGLVPSRRESGVALVRLEDCEAMRPAPGAAKVPRKRAAVEQPAPEQPQAGDVEAFS